jgi:hypothetical protein
MRSPPDPPIRDARPEPSLSARTAREARLKAALKANMGRRKAQARARRTEGAPADPKGKD